MREPSRAGGGRPGASLWFEWWYRRVPELHLHRHRSERPRSRASFHVRSCVAPRARRAAGERCGGVWAVAAARAMRGRPRGAVQKDQWRATGQARLRASVDPPAVRAWRGARSRRGTGPRDRQSKDGRKRREREAGRDAETLCSSASAARHLVPWKCTHSPACCLQC